MQERIARNAPHKVTFAEPGDGEVARYELKAGGCFAEAAPPLSTLGAADSASITALRHRSHDKSRPEVKCKAQSRHSVNESGSFEVADTP